MSAGVTCNRCGETGLVWEVSKNGRNYLAYRREIRGESGGVAKVISPAHSCDAYRERLEIHFRDEALDRVRTLGLDDRDPAYALELDRHIGQIRAEHETELAARLEKDRNTLRRGSNIHVVGGDTLAEGTTGFVFWLGDGRDGFPRVGIEIDGGRRVFVPASDVERLP